MARLFYITFLLITSFLTAGDNPKVVVVGGGLGGLTTAYRLLQKEVDVEVYEARNRVGGRILTVSVGGNLAELGGININDGGNADNMRRLIDECGLEIQSNKIITTHLYFNGEKLIDNRELLKRRNFQSEKLRNQLDALAERCKNMREILNALLDEADPFYKEMSTRLAAYEGAPVEELSTFYIQSLYHTLTSYTQLNDKGVNYLKIKGGNALLPEKIAGVLGSRLKLNHVLKSVSKRSDGVYALTFHNGKTVKADILVLAIPCSVYEDIIFDPGVLPLDRLTAIKNVRYGTNAKIHIPLKQFPENSMDFINERSISYFNPYSRLFTLYYIGEASRFSKETIFRTYCQDRPLVEMGLGELCPPMIAPEYALDLSFATYENPVGYSWPNDPFAKGSYSYIAPGQEALLTATKTVADETVKCLFAPVDNALYFVGEHASILTEVSGTMEAACESGERAARMIKVALKTSQRGRSWPKLPRISK